PLLVRHPRPGPRVQDGRAGDPAPAREGPGRARLPVRHPAVPRGGARQRLDAHDDPRATRGLVHRAGEEAVKRRAFISSAGAGAIAAGIAVRGARAAPSGGGFDVAVVGAGTFGAWTAWHLRRAGRRVVLLDAYGAGNS